MNSTFTTNYALDTAVTDAVDSMQTEVMTSLTTLSHLSVFLMVGKQQEVAKREIAIDRSSVAISSADRGKTKI